jgi:hypothetical protein
MTEIDEDRLKYVAVQHVWTHGDRYEWCLGDFTEDEASEVLRLARLGLWAEKHGAPALRLADEELQDRNNLGMKEGLALYRKAMGVVEDALAALPKEPS